MLETIELLNGNLIECHKKKGVQDCHPIDNSMQLDMTGKFMQIGKRRSKRRKMDIPLEKKADAQAFLNNAHYLFDHNEDILKDSRMFLCPVPFVNELAYLGTSGFNLPTLGVYIEWWGTCQDTRLLDENGEKWLVCHLAGSPLTHCNSCLVVNPEGKTVRLNIGQNFMDLCRKFKRINRRYDNAKLIYEAYSLNEVLNILRKKDKYRKVIQFITSKYKTIINYLF